jgi:hypothetical protein
MDKKRKNTGSTMVEVLVGFTLLMILMVGLTRLIKISSEMVFKTRDMINDQKSLVEEFYKENHGSLTKTVVSDDTLALQETDSNGQIISDGVNISLGSTKIEKISDDESGLSIYQIYRDTSTP